MEVAAEEYQNGTASGSERLALQTGALKNIPYRGRNS